MTDAVTARLDEEVRRYIINELPIHLIDLRDARVCDSHAVFERLRPAIHGGTAEDLPEDIRAYLLNPVPSSRDATRLHDFIRKRVKYAILSHRCSDSEPAYGELPDLQSSPTTSSRYKVAKFCEIAHRDYGMEFAWVDGCCIDRSSDAELGRSIRSMYKWYANADICIAHLADTSPGDDFGGDEWFRRGWTLLELLAPKRLKFYDRGWNPVSNESNDKDSAAILENVERATSIAPQDLQQFDPKNPETYQISKRMRWAANRETTLVEDRAYSLMAVFGVSMDIAYGEGLPRAFSRLFREIIHFSNSPEALNWVGEPAVGASLRSLAYPSSPNQFIGSNDVAELTRSDGISFAANGLGIKLVVLPATLQTWETTNTASLLCLDVPVQADCLPDFKPKIPNNSSTLEFAIGAWNFSTVGQCEPSSNLLEAVLLCRVVGSGNKDQWKKVPTQSFVRLHLRTKSAPRGKRWENYLQTVIL